MKRIVAISIALFFCAGSRRFGVASATAGPAQKHRLPNGLELILHEDHALPIVSLNICYHVGAAFERPGRSGFAHLFEHLLFSGSAHIPKRAQNTLRERTGALGDGFTTEDHTCYFESAPSNQLERFLWVHSDRMGFLM